MVLLPEPPHATATAGPFLFCGDDGTHFGFLVKEATGCCGGGGRPQATAAEAGAFKVAAGGPLAVVVLVLAPGSGGNASG